MRRGEVADGSDRLETGNDAGGDRPGAAGERGWSFSVLVLVLATSAVVSVLGRGRGWYVIDNQSVFYWNPWRVATGLWDAWNPTLDLGGPPPTYAPGIYLLTSALRGLGAEPWLVQRLFHAFLLTLGGVGVALVARWFLPRVGPAHLVVAVVYMYAPFSVTFLLPSWLYMNYALAPWFLLALLRGVTGQRWRWAAVFALALVGSGIVNPPGVALAMVPLVPAGAYLVHVERRVRWREIAAWAAAAGALSVLVLLPALFRFASESEILAANLSQSEGVEAVSRSSSWSESWRGLGYWLSYWGEGEPAVPQSARYLTSPALALLTFVPVCAALAVVWWSRRRARIFLAGSMVAALTVMVGVYPFGDPSPYGRLLQESYERSPFLFSFRNTYKAGPGLMIGTAVLLGLGYVAVVSWSERRRPGSRILPRAALAVTLVFAVISSTPVWSGSVYRDGQRVGAIPDHYVEATQFLDQQPGHGRVLILPLAAQDRYRWADAPTFEIFQPLLDRPHLRRDILSHSGELTTDLMHQLAEWMSGDDVAAASIRPILHRLGVEHVLVRNDLAWERVGAPRPAAVRDLLRSPVLERVAAFGQPGDGVVAVDEPPVAIEADLPPVEIYRVEGAAGSARAQSPSPSLLVSGDGGAWPALAERGWLDGAGPIRYTGQLDAADIEAELDGGATLHITDTNRRRAGGFGADSHTLTASDERGDGMDLFDRSGSQSTTVHGDAIDLRDLSPPTIFPVGRAHRPAAAFDGDPTTAWFTGRMDPTPHHGLRIDLAKPETVSRARVVVAFPTDGTRRVSGATMSFSDGESVPIDLTEQERTVRFEPRVTEWIEIRIASVAGFGDSPVGFSEIEMDGLDVREFIRAPDDAVRAVAGRPDGDALLESSPIVYNLRRLTGPNADEEATMRREIRGIDGRPLEVQGQLSLAPTAADELVASLSETPVIAHGSNRYPRDLAGSGLFAVDDEITTGWSAVPEAGSTLTIEFPRRPIAAMEIDVETGPQVTAVRVIEVAVGDSQPISVDIDASATCPRQHELTDGRSCALVRVELPPHAASSARIELMQLGPVRPVGVERPARILDVRLNGEQNGPHPRTVVSECTRPGVVIAGSSVPVRMFGTLERLLAGGSMRFEGCANVRLGDGWERIESPLGVVVDELQLSSGHPAPTGSISVPVQASGRSPSRIEVAGSSSAGVILVSGQAFDSRWRASVDGVSLGPPQSFDLQAGWRLPAGMEGDEAPAVVHVWLDGATAYRWMVVVSALACALCLALVIIGRRGGTCRERSEPPVSPPPTLRRRGRRRTDRISLRRARLVAGAGSVVLGFLIAGPIAALVALAGAIVVVPRPDAARLVALGAVAALALAAVFTIPPLGPDMAVTPEFGSLRETANGLGRAAALFLVVALASFAANERRPSDGTATGRGAVRDDAIDGADEMRVGP